jgi:hypothetical protein
MSFVVNQAVDDAWEHLPLCRTYPVTLYAQQAKSLMWISVRVRTLPYSAMRMIVGH